MPPKATASMGSTLKPEPETTETNGQDVSLTLDILAGRVNHHVNTEEASLVIKAYNAVQTFNENRMSNRNEIRLLTEQINQLTKYLIEMEGQIPDTKLEFYRRQLDTLIDLQKECLEEERSVGVISQTIRDRQLQVLSTPRSKVLPVASYPPTKKTPISRLRADARKPKDTPVKQEDRSTSDDRSTPKSKKRKTAPASATRGGGRKRNTALGPRTRSRDLETGI